MNLKKLINKNRKNVTWIVTKKNCNNYRNSSCNNQQKKKNIINSNFFCGFLFLLFKMKKKKKLSLQLKFWMNYVTVEWNFENDIFFLLLFTKCKIAPDPPSLSQELSCSGFVYLGYCIEVVSNHFYSCPDTTITQIRPHAVNYLYLWQWQPIRQYLSF